MGFRHPNLVTPGGSPVTDEHCSELGATPIFARKPNILPILPRIAASTETPHQEQLADGGRFASRTAILVGCSNHFQAVRRTCNRSPRIRWSEGPRPRLRTRWATTNRSGDKAELVQNAKPGVFTVATIMERVALRTVCLRAQGAPWRWALQYFANACSARFSSGAAPSAGGERLRAKD
jgi:hypothetical protein